MVDLSDSDSVFTLDSSTDVEELRGWTDDSEADDTKQDDEHQSLEKWRLAEYESECKLKCKRRRIRDVQSRWSAHAVRPGHCVRTASTMTTTAVATTAPGETWQAQGWTLTNRVPQGRVLLAADEALGRACLIDAVRFTDQCSHAPCLLCRWMLVTPPEVADPQYTQLRLREMRKMDVSVVQRLLHAAVASGHADALLQLQRCFDMYQRPDLALTACEFGRAELVPGLLLRVPVDVNKRPVDGLIVQLFERAAFSGHADVLQTLFARWPGIVGDTKSSTVENKNVNLSSVARRTLRLSMECNWPLVATAVGRACWRYALGEPPGDHHPARLKVLRSLIEPELLSAVCQERWAVAQALVPFCPGFDVGCVTRPERRHASLETLVAVPEESGRRLVAPLLFTFLMGTHCCNARTGCSVWGLTSNVLFDRNVLSLVFDFV